MLKSSFCPAASDGAAEQAGDLLLGDGHAVGAADLKTDERMYLLPVMRFIAGYRE